MDMSLLLRLITAGGLVWHAVVAWRRNDRPAVIDAVLIGVSMLALLIPDTLPVARYGIAGVAMVIVIARNIKRDLIEGSDTYARGMTIGLLVFVLSMIPALSMAPPRPQWTKYVAISGGILMIAALLRPLFWMTSLLFSAHRLSRDLKHSRPPRAADERALGIDLSVLRRPDVK
ncbi:MAG: hypothetical protein IT185_06615 [Acidobacteria bacterium]|nr:hypothetical protein [Acidobacteriota bacterium]